MRVLSVVFALIFLAACNDNTKCPTCEPSPDLELSAAEWDKRDLMDDFKKFDQEYNKIKFKDQSKDEEYKTKKDSLMKEWNKLINGDHSSKVDSLSLDELIRQAEEAKKSTANKIDDDFAKKADAVYDRMSKAKKNLQIYKKAYDEALNSGLDKAKALKESVDQASKHLQEIKKKFSDNSEKSENEGDKKFYDKLKSAESNFKFFILHHVYNATTKRELIQGPKNHIKTFINEVIKAQVVVGGGDGNASVKEGSELSKLSDPNKKDEIKNLFNKMEKSLEKALDEIEKIPD